MGLLAEPPLHSLPGTFLQVSPSVRPLMSTATMPPNEVNQISTKPDTPSNHINKATPTMDDERESLLFMAKLAEQTSRIEGNLSTNFINHFIPPFPLSSRKCRVHDQIN